MKTLAFTIDENLADKFDEFVGETETLRNRSHAICVAIELMMRQYQAIHHYGGQ